MEKESGREGRGEEWGRQKKSEIDREEETKKGKKKK